MSRVWAGLITVLALVVGASEAGATVLFSNTANGLSASAYFTISAGAGNTQTLTILLTNTDTATGSGAPTDPATVLTGLFFNLGTGTFTPTSATLISGADATTFNATRPASDPDVKAGSIDQTAQCDVASCAGQTNVGGEWSYAAGGANWLNGTTQGIASSGYLSGNTSAGNFNGPNYDDPAALDGINFGVVPYGWTDYSGNGGLDKDPLIEGTVKFVLSIPKGLTEADIKNVYFTYGTAPGEGTLVGTTSATPTTSGTPTSGNVPEPAALSILGVALAGFGYRLRRKAS